MYPIPILQIQLDPGEMTLMSAGACGAFVHGLEDEFMGECGMELQLRSQ